MSHKNVQNIAFVALQHAVTTLLPFLTIPYVARVLGVEHNGLYFFTWSIANVFAVCFSFGFALYGANKIAQTKEAEKDYLEIQCLQWIFVFVGLLLFCTTSILFFEADQLSILLLQGLMILSFFFDNSWYYQGIAAFKTIVTRNIIVKVLGVIGVFLFVKAPEDLWLYIVLIHGSMLLGNLLLFMKALPLFRYWKSIEVRGVFGHIKPSFYLFLPQLAVLLYSQFDKLFIGGSGDIAGLANYQQAERFVLFVYSLLMIPTAVIGQWIAGRRFAKQHEEVERALQTGLHVYLLGSAFVAIIVGMKAEEIVFIMYGSAYETAAVFLNIICVVIVCKSVGTIIGSWYLIPLKMNKQFAIPLVAGTAINILLNLIFVPLYGVIAAVFILLVTEVVVLLIQFLLVKELFFMFDLGLVAKCFVVFIVAAVLSYSILASVQSNSVIINLFGFLVMYAGITGLLLIVHRPFREQFIEVKSKVTH